MENVENKSSSLENTYALKNARKKGVSKGAITTGIIALIILIILGFIVHNNYKKEHNKQTALMENQKTTFTKQLTTRDSTINEWLTTADEIEKELNLIKQKENVITFSSAKSELTVNRRDQILNDIKYINTLLENNKKKINSLTAQLNSSGGMIKGLQAKLADLDKTVKQYESDMADLKSTLTKKDDEIGQLNVKVTDLDNTISKQNQELIDQTNIMNEAYIASGTYKDLKEKGIVDKEGGFLGLGKKEILIPSLNENLFTKIDIRNTKTIPVNSRVAKIIPERPADSYKLVHENNGAIAYVEIQNPDTFWKISKFTVVEIRK